MLCILDGDFVITEKSYVIQCGLWVLQVLTQLRGTRRGKLLRKRS